MQSIIGGVRIDVEALRLFTRVQCECGNIAAPFSDWCAACEQTPICPRELPKYTPAPFKSHRKSGMFVGLKG